ncbi:SDR family NAD(P)-dependent oxidoreductase [Sandaracinus amylolyticus]|uniref:SDR family NAD(P)-dependent oxidoreductase n=1 Tax=Sandaracinus amylolyticus TaxID=927083 RepID=UPI001F258888|nr:SDR family NAD(P)-dependent oxidoreductase [Sandaracinus amylolyticus]UJR87000.1 Hypothetical protein I5071_91010 [Sandaracinus amylolyticus]
MTMQELRDRVVLVTGAASGIGRQTAFAFAEEGARLELVDLDPRGLEITARLASAFGAKVSTHVADVSEAASMEALAARTPCVDVLVNNAGIGAAGAFLDASLETWRRTLDVNLMGVVHGCRAFVPAMVARRAGGHVVNVASVAGLAAPRAMSVYAASKHAVVGLSESLRAELAPHRIGVSCICPGVIDTPIVEKTRFDGESLGSAVVRDRIERFYRWRRYPPRKVADAIVRAVRRDAGIVPVSPESWAIWIAQRVAPGLVARLGDAEQVFARGVEAAR